MVFDEYVIETPDYGAVLHIPRVAPDEGYCRILTNEAAYFIDRGTALAYLEYCRQQYTYSITERVRP